MRIMYGKPLCGCLNFGPTLESNKTVKDLIAETCPLKGSWRNASDAQVLEAGRLHLQIDKAHHRLGWSPHWSFSTTVERTVSWYYCFNKDVQPSRVA